MLTFFFFFKYKPGSVLQL